MTDLSATDLSGIGTSIVCAWWFGRWLCYLFGYSGVPEIPSTITVIVKHEYPAETEE